MLLLTDHRGLPVKKLSFVYYTTRIDFLIKILNRDVEKFWFLARESLKLDMKKKHDLSIKGNFFTIQDVNRKFSNSFLFNWNINDYLCIFVVKAGLSLFLTNFISYLMVRKIYSRCSFGCYHTCSCFKRLHISF